MKPITIVAIGLAVIVAIVGARIILKEAPEATIFLVDNNEKPVGTAFLSVDFKLDRTSDIPIVFALIDLDGDSQFEENEIAVDKISAPIEKSLPNIFPISEKIVSQINPQTYKVKIILDNKEEIIKRADVKRWDYGEISSQEPGYVGGAGEFIESVLDLPEAGAQAANNVFNKDVPDINPRKGKKNECVPISAANSLIWLAKKHKFEEKLPASQDDLIDELGKDVGWTQKGTEPKKFLPGKEAITQRRKLPLINKKFDNEVKEGESQLWKKILSELKDGEDVELVIEFKASPRGAATGSHAVTVVGANSEDGNQNITIHDILTPQGNDTYKVDRNGQVVGYPFGKAYVAFIISESFTTDISTPAPIPSKVQIPAPAEEPVPEEEPAPAPEPIQEPQPTPPPAEEQPQQPPRGH